MLPVREAVDRLVGPRRLYFFVPDCYSFILLWHLLAALLQDSRMLGMHAATMACALRDKVALALGKGKNMAKTKAHSAYNTRH